MTHEEILKELSHLKKQYVHSRGTTCEVYGKNKTNAARRVNGCCITVTKEAK